MHYCCRPEGQCPRNCQTNYEHQVRTRALTRPIEGKALTKSNKPDTAGSMKTQLGLQLLIYFFWNRRSVHPCGRCAEFALQLDQQLAGWLAFLAGMGWVGTLWSMVVRLHVVSVECPCRTLMASSPFSILHCPCHVLMCASQGALPAPTNDAVDELLSIYALS